MRGMKFHFSIRDLLWLTVVATLIVGWHIDHWKMRVKISRARLDAAMNPKIVLIADPSVSSPPNNP
jgi:hypothetical protein